MKRIPAFTFIEILVVATIIIILTTIGMASFRTANQSARDAKRKADLESIRQAMVLYKAQHGSYATSQNELLDKYITPPFPRDPANTEYTATYDVSNPIGQTFCFCAVLDDPTKGNHNNTSCNGTWATTGQPNYCVRQP